MPGPSDSVFLIRSHVGASSEMGTCFLIHRDSERWYFVTCQHVIKSADVGGLQVAGVEAVVTASGKDDSYDLAVVSILKQTLAPNTPLGRVSTT